MGSTSGHAQEVAQGVRFEFGKNWSRFLRGLTPDRIEAAESSLRDMLGVTDLEGRRFLDIGCGSGLFSLAARRLGAIVHSFDYDPHSVGCACMLGAGTFRATMSGRSRRAPPSMPTTSGRSVSST